MGRSHRQYSSYRGRRTANDLLKIIAAVLLVLVVVALGLFFFGQDYLEEWKHSLPFVQSQEGQTSSSQGEISVEIRPSSEEDEAEEQPKPAPQAAMTALELPCSAVLDGTAADLLQEAGANALILEMKDEQGMLGWSSEQALASLGKVNSQTQGVNQALEQWNQGGVYTVARICCFRDNTLPYQRNSVALRASYGNWRDEQSLRWLNPDSAEVQSYLAGLCGELAQMGFDEILLDCCSFPTQGRLEAIVEQGSYATRQFTQTLESFLDQVEQAVAPYETVVSIRTSRQALSQEGSGGLNAAVLEQYAVRMWLVEDAEQPKLSQLLEQAGISQWEQRLVVEQPESTYGLVAQGMLPEEIN